MHILTPLSDMTFPLQQPDHLVHRLLRVGEPYLVSEASARLYRQRMEVGDVRLLLREAEARPVSATSERTLVFFSGEVGDAAAIGRGLHPGDAVDFVTAIGDECLLDTGAVFQYPVPLRLADQYDTWVEFDARAADGVEIPEAFAKAIGKTFPEEGPTWDTTPPVHLLLADALYRLLPQNGRPLVGVSMKSASHYRSWPTLHAYHTMCGLAQAGYDCCIIGGTAERVIFKVDGQTKDLWGEGLYDLSGLCANLPEVIALLSLMEVVVAPDNGMLQLACALGKPTVGVFGPTWGECRSKYAPTLTWVNGEGECSPCWCKGDRPPCESTWCDAIGRIPPEEIIEAAQKAAAEVP